MAYTSFAVVDLETTGNQLEHDEIIQIGITFVRDNKISGTYHSMIRTDLELSLIHISEPTRQEVYL